MELAARTGVWHGGAPLPYLRRVAYLESHGTEWIDTRVYYSHETYMRAVASFSRDAGKENMIACMDEGNDHRKSFAIGWYLGYGIFGSFDSMLPAESGIKPEIGRFYRLENSRQGIVVDGNLYIREEINDFESRYTLFLFHFARNGKIVNGYGAQVRISDILITESNEKVMHLLPVLDFDSRPAMYDEVSGQFFYNQGTGEFTWGELGEE